MRSGKTIRPYSLRAGWLCSLILLDPKGEVSVLYGAWALPLTYLIDREGVIIARAFGPRPWAGQQAKALMTRLLSPHNS